MSEDPRFVRSRERLHRAAREELTAKGWGGFTMDGVSRRADVSRSTLYRHYRDRQTVIVAALADTSSQPVVNALPREARVHDLLAHLVSALDGAPGSLLPALVEGASQDPVLADLLSDFSARRREALTTAIAEWHPTIDDPDLAATALAGAVFYRRLMTNTPLRPEEIPALVKMVLG